MTEFGKQIQKVANSFTDEFTVKDIRNILGWENTVSIDTRIRYTLNRLYLHKERRPDFVFYSHPGIRIIAPQVEA